MDTPEEFTHVSLCAGYAGIDLGLRRAVRGIRTVAFSEIEAFACANLVSKIEAGHLDAAPIWTDLKTFPWSDFRDRVDFLSGGYPCQPFSLSGNRLGFDDPRHLWPSIAAGIKLMRPRVCFFENVEGHITLGLLEVLRDLRDLGYRVTAGLFSAVEVGAPQKRKRIYILAHMRGARLEGYARNVTRRDQPGWITPEPVGSTPASGICSGVLWPARPGQRQFSWEPPRVLADDYREREQQSGGGKPQSWRRFEHRGQKILADSESAGRQSDPRSIHSHASEEGSDPRGCEQSIGSGENTPNGEAESSLGGDSDGRAGGMDYAELCVTCDNRTDELRLLGNGVMPEVAERAFRTLWDELDLI